MEYMNSKHDSISFTEELEENNQLPFLDVSVSRTDDGFTTNLYRKSTFSGVFTNFFSYLSIQFKACLVSTLLFRCYQLTSTTDAFHKEVKRLRGILARNSYPLEFIDQCIAAFLNKRNCDNNWARGNVWWFWSYWAWKIQKQFPLKSKGKSSNKETCSWT